MSKRLYSKAFINHDNLVIALEHMISLQDKYKFENPRLNENIWKLSHMLNELEIDTSGRYISEFENIEGGKNKQFSDLNERYIHVSYNDPCSLKHEIKELLIAGTDTVEVDISSTVVYLFAKFISHDKKMLEAYRNKDFYSQLKKGDRDEQKKLVQIWLQGYYRSDIPYNKLFPITGKYLKQTALKENDLYKKNSGLFRDKEVKLLNAIMNDVQLLFHLHDGFYVQKRNTKKLTESVKKHYGNNVKYKTHDYSKDKYTAQDIYEIIDKIDWKNKDTTPIPEIAKSTFRLYADPLKGLIYRYSDTKEEVGAYITQQHFCKSLYDIVKNNKIKGVYTSIACIMQY